MSGHDHSPGNMMDFVLGSFAGAELDDATRSRMAAGMPGVTLFREHNVSDRGGFTALTSELHAAAGELPAIVAVDQFITPRICSTSGSTRR